MPRTSIRSPTLISPQNTNKDGIQEVAPVPIFLSEDAQESPEDLSPPPTTSTYRLLSRSLPYLGTLQKCSSISFTVFSFIHGASVLVAPAISTSLAEELISMGRTIYQAPGLEETLVWGSLGVHVLSGIAMRLIRGWIYRIRHGERKAHQRQRQQKQSSIGLESGVVETALDGSVTLEKDDSVGLTGGVSGYATGAPKKSWIYRKLGLSPLQFAGYLSIPLTLFHSIQTRLVPLSVEGDSSYINLEYIAYLFSKSQGLWKPALNYVVYPTLILITTYHTIYGMLKWLRVKDLRLRKIAMNFISLISLLGMYSLYCVSKIDTQLPKFMTQRFDKYLGAFYCGL